MPEKLIEITADVPEGGWWTQLDRVTGPDDVILLAAQVNGSPPYTLKVYESGETPTAAVYSRTGAAASEIIVPITVNSYWTVDPIGYNMFDTLKADGTHFTSTGGRTYLAEWTLNTSVFGPIMVRHVLKCRSAMST